MSIYLQKKNVLYHWKIIDKKSEATLFNLLMDKLVKVTGITFITEKGKIFRKKLHYLKSCYNYFSAFRINPAIPKIQGNQNPKCWRKKSCFIPSRQGWDPSSVFSSSQDPNKLAEKLPSVDAKIIWSKRSRHS